MPTSIRRRLKSVKEKPTDEHTAILGIRSRPGRAEDQNLLSEDKIVSVDEYWADDGDAPQWRKDKKIGRPIMERRQAGI